MTAILIIIGSIALTALLFGTPKGEKPEKPYKPKKKRSPDPPGWGTPHGF